MVAYSSAHCDRNSGAEQTEILAKLSFSSPAPTDRLPDKVSCRRNGVRFASCSEAIIGELLERFVTGFRLELGISFQVAARSPTCDQTWHIDFCVHGVLLEYHPPRTRASRGRWADFPSRQDYLNFQRRLDMAPSREARRRILQDGTALARQHYASKRRSQIDADPALRGRELIIATNPGEFYELVLRRFASPPPSKAIFEALYEQIKHDVLRGNPAYQQHHFAQRRRSGPFKLRRYERVDPPHAA